MNIVKVHDFGLTHTGQPYMVMDLVEGKSLSQVLDELGELPTAQCLIIFIDICDALVHAHEKGVLHRDLKTSNIMLTTTSERAMLAKLVDFGIAKILDEDADSPVQKLTQTGELFGSPLYMSPEQCYGKKVDRRSDIYSFGCLMFECLTGRVPFRGDTVVETISKQMTATPPLLSEVRPDKTFPRRLVDVVDKCLAKNPEGRYRTINDVRTELVSIQHAERKNLAKEKAKFIAWMKPEEITSERLCECLSDNSGLVKLNLGGARVTDQALDCVGRQAELRELDLHDTAIGDKGVEALKRLAAA